VKIAHFVSDLIKLKNKIMLDPKQLSLKNKLRKLLVDESMCSVQHTGWPCGTCFYAISEELTNKDWQTVLLVRGDYKRSELNNIPKKENVENRIKRIIRIVENN